MFRHMARSFQGLPAHLKEFSVLWVHDRGFFGAEAKEFRIEFFIVFQDRCRGNIVFVAHAGFAFACLRKICLA